MQNLVVPNTAEEARDTANPDDSSPLVECSFLLEKKEYIEMNFMLYYTRPLSIIYTALGVLLLAAYFIFYRVNDISEIRLYWLIFGLSFTFAVPLLLLFAANIRYKKDAVLKKPYNYKFYSDHYVVSQSENFNKLKYSDLVKITETKSSFLFFMSKLMVYIVPKRALIRGEKDIEILRKIVKVKKAKTS